MKKRILILSALLILFSPLSVSAKESGPNDLSRTKKNLIERERKLAANISSPSAKNRGKELLKERAEEFRASQSARKAEFKAKLETIKDQRKKQLLEKLTDKMSRVNTRRTDHWKKILARLTDILNRIKSTGKHNAELDAAIATADAKLAAASAAVENQALKDYSINIASQSALKLNAGSAISAEQRDLQNTLRPVNEAKFAVHKALMILKRSFGGPLPKTATPSATPATQSGAVSTSSGTTP